MHKPPPPPPRLLLLTNISDLLEKQRADRKRIGEIKRWNQNKNIQKQNRKQKYARNHSTSRTKCAWVYKQKSV